jgi:hypothetical protein
MSTCPTGKVTYWSELKAKIALASTRRPGAPGRREECRTYRCPDCHGWHLTSLRKRRTR